MTEKKLFDVFFSALRSVLLGSEFPRETLSEFSEADFLRLYRLSDQQDLAHLVGLALQKENLLPGGSVSESFQKKIQLSVFLTERIEYARKCCCEILEKNGIPYVSLKGAVLRNYYPQTWMRTSTDADILISDENISMATELLISSGFRLISRSSHDVIFHAPNEMTIELHFDLVEAARMPKAAALLQRSWDFTLPAEGKRFERVFTPDFFLLYHLAHMAKHINNGGIGIRFFIDLYLIHTKFQCDPVLSANFMKDADLSRFNDVAFHLSRVWLGEAQHSQASELLEQFVLSTGIFGDLDGYVSMRAARKNRFAYVWNRIFAPYETLRHTYPELDGRPYLIFYFQIKRLLTHISKGRWKRSGKETALLFSQDNDKIARTARLLETLELSFHD